MYVDLLVCSLKISTYQVLQNLLNVAKVFVVSDLLGNFQCNLYTEMFFIYFQDDFVNYLLIFL